MSHVLVQLVIELFSVRSHEQLRLQCLPEQRQRRWRTDCFWQAVPDWGRSSRETSTATGGSTGARNHQSQWLKCNGTQGNAVPPPPISGSKSSPTSDCYNARKSTRSRIGGPHLNVPFPHLKFCTLTTDQSSRRRRAKLLACVDIRDSVWSWPNRYSGAELWRQR